MLTIIIYVNINNFKKIITLAFSIREDNFPRLAKIVMRPIENFLKCVCVCVGNNNNNNNNNKHNR